ncbi:MAG: hypothetical protein U0625_13585 [Phycisphaerales bacterium]
MTSASPTTRARGEGRGWGQASIQPPRLSVADRLPWPTLAVVGCITLSMMGVIAIGSGPAEEGCGSPADPRPGQITTMVVRFNQFLPGGAAPIELVDGRVYHPSDLAPLVTAGYCGDADLWNQVDVKLGWVWSSANRKFTPELGPDAGFPWVLLTLDAAVGAAIAGAIIACGVAASRLWPHRAARSPS